mmetsp:Transcript_27215/g.86459  ORF Transcript_27215/g.86459 Transcript_27215/m.86459 type:complete len:224 (+) Transcript_27215:1299-1970(+)
MHMLKCKHVRLTCDFVECRSIATGFVWSGSVHTMHHSSPSTSGHACICMRHSSMSSKQISHWTCTQGQRNSCSSSSSYIPLQAHFSFRLHLTIRLSHSSRACCAKDSNGTSCMHAWQGLRRAGHTSSSWSLRSSAAMPVPLHLEHFTGRRGHSSLRCLCLSFFEAPSGKTLPQPQLHSHWFTGAEARCVCSASNRRVSGPRSAVLSCDRALAASALASSSRRC